MQSLFTYGQDGYFAYRIPGLVVTKAGTVLAFCEGRRNSIDDDGDIDLLLRRSTDGGNTWTPQQVICDWGGDTAGNPCPVVDRDTGVVWLTLCRNNSRIYVTRSNDDGVTWSAPVEITAAVKPKEATHPKFAMGTGPGHGLQLAGGRLLMPCWCLDQDMRGHTFCFFSDDHGANWRLGSFVPGVTWGDECEAVETKPNTVYLNIRSGRRPFRVFSISHDGGDTWSDVRYHEDAPEPHSCQGSVIRLTDSKRPDRNRLLAVNPVGQARRTELIARLSYDEGRTWTVGKTLWPGAAAYSDLCVLDDLTVLSLFEAGDKERDSLKLARFSLEWLTDGRDRPSRR